MGLPVPADWVGVGGGGGVPDGGVAGLGAAGSPTWGRCPPGMGGRRALAGRADLFQPRSVCAVHKTISKL